MPSRKCLIFSVHEVALIFVAHSYGALYAGYFILKNPNVVQGLLLVDPVPREFNFSNQLIHKYKKGISEAKTQPASTIYNKYGGSKAEVIYQMLGFNESKHQIKQLGPINDRIHVIILSSTEMEKEHPLKENWYTSQIQWLNKNHMSKIIRTPSDHFIQLKEPQKVCNTLKKIVNQWISERLQ